MDNKKRKMPGKFTRQTDLNYIIMKDNHGRKFIQRTVYSRLLITGLLVLLQLFFFAYFIIRMQQYIEFYFLVSILVSAGFMIYLTNTKGKNEFKIAWFVPMVIFPIVGVGAYLLYHTNAGGRRAKKALQKSQKETFELLPAKETVTPVLEKFSDISDLQTYLLNRNFFPYENNQISYFSCGEDFYPDFFNALKNAKKFIFIETFILKVEETWAFILEILAEKVKEGVEVRVMYDAFGSQIASQKSYQKYLEAHGIECCVFSPIIPLISTKQNTRDHRKIYLIDGEVVYSGGLNLANEYFNYGKNHFEYWKDNAIKIEGEAVRGFTTMFLQNWNMEKRSRKYQDNYSKYINIPYAKYDYPGIAIPYGDEAYNSEDVAENIYLYIINSAKKYLHITSPYVLLDNTFQEAIIFAAQKGIDVKIIVPSLPDHIITFCIGKTFLKTLVEKGVKVYLYKKGFIHAKTFISDDKIATVGSVNLDYRSLYHHFECGTIMYQMPVINDIESDFQNTLLDCEEMKPGDYEKLPWVKRVCGRIFRIFAPLM